MTTTPTIDLTATLDLAGVFAALVEIGLAGHEAVDNQPQPQSILVPQTPQTPQTTTFQEKIVLDYNLNYYNTNYTILKNVILNKIPVTNSPSIIFESNNNNIRAILLFKNIDDIKFIINLNKQYFINNTLRDYNQQLEYTFKNILTNATQYISKIFITTPGPSPTKTTIKLNNKIKNQKIIYKSGKINESIFPSPKLTKPTKITLRQKNINKYIKTLVITFLIINLIMFIPK